MSPRRNKFQLGLSSSYKHHSTQRRSPTESDVSPLDNLFAPSRLGFSLDAALVERPCRFAKTDDKTSDSASLPMSRTEKAGEILMRLSLPVALYSSPTDTSPLQGLFGARRRDFNRFSFGQNKNDPSDAWSESDPDVAIEYIPPFRQKT